MANRNVPLFFGIILIVLSVLAALAGGVWGILLAAFLGIGGVGALKSAIYGSDQEIDELSGKRPLSKKSQDDFMNRL